MLKPQNKIRAFRKVFFALYFRRPLSLDRYNGCSKEDVRSMYGERPRAVEIVHATADELTSPVRQLRLAFGRRKKKSQWLMEITSEYVFVSCWDYTNWGAVQGSALQLFTAALKDAPDLALDGVQLGVTDLFENDARAAPLTDIFLPDSPYLTKASRPAAFPEQSASVWSHVAPYRPSGHPAFRSAQSLMVASQSIARPAYPVRQSA